MSVRVLAAAEANAAVNAPDVLPAVNPTVAALDLGLYVSNPAHVVLECRGAVAFFPYLGAGRYAMHYLVPSKVRGPDAARALEEMLAWVFTERGAMCIEGDTPVSNRPARVMNRRLHAAPTGITVDGAGRPCIHYELRRSTWDSLRKRSAGS